MQGALNQVVVHSSFTTCEPSTQGSTSGLSSAGPGLVVMLDGVDTPQPWHQAALVPFILSSSSGPGSR